MSTLVSKEIIANVLMAAQATAQQTVRRAGEDANLTSFYEGFMTALSVVATGLDVPVNFAAPEGLSSRAWNEAWPPSSALMIGEGAFGSSHNEG